MEQDFKKQFYQSIPGTVLIDCKKVGYPFFKVVLDLSIRQKRQLLFQEEFILRCIASQINEREAILNFLGIDNFVVDKTLPNLLSEGLIKVEPEGVKITSKGQEVLNDHLIEDIVMERYKIFVDALTDKVYLEENSRLKYINNPENPLRSFVERPQPKIENFTKYMDRLQQVVRGKNEDFDLLAVVDVVECKQVWHELDLALYKNSPDATLLQYEFFSRQNIASEYRENIEKLQQRGEDVLGHLLFPDLNLEAERIQLEQPVLVELNIPKAEVVEFEKLKQKQQFAIELATSPVEIKQINDTLQAIQTKHGIMEIIHTFEHREYLEKAFDTAKKRILIISPWIKRSVVNYRFITSLEYALKRKVEVTILYGYKEFDGKSNNDEESIKKLDKLAKSYQQLKMCKVKNTHSKILICDEQFVVVTSFNFLSFRGDPNYTYRDETGIVVRDPQTIHRLYEHGQQLMEEVKENPA